MNDIDNSLKKIATGAWIVFIGVFISKFFSYGYRLIVSRIGPADYGVLYLGLAIVGVLGIIAALGLEGGVLRYVSYYRGREELDKVKGTILYSLKISSLASISLAILLFILSDWLAINVFHTEKLAIVLKILAVLIPLDAIRKIFLSSLKAFQNIKYEVYAKNICESVTKVVLVTLVIFFGFGLLGATLAYIISVFVSLVVAFYFFERKTFNFITNGIKTFYSRKELVTLSLPLLGAEILITLVEWIDTFMIAHFKTASDVGIYNVALPTAQLTIFIPSVLLTLFIPVLTELFSQKKYDSLRSVYRIVTKWVFLINLPLITMLILFPKEIINLFFPIEYVAGYLVLMILTIGYFIYFYAHTSYLMLIIIGKTKQMFFIYSIGILCNIVLNYFLIQAYGITGAALATTITYTLLAIILLLYTKKIIKAKIFNLSYIKGLISILVTVFIMLFVRQLNINYVLLLIIAGILVLLIYILLLILTRSFEKEDIMIVEAIQRKFSIKWLDKLIKRL